MCENQVVISHSRKTVLIDVRCVLNGRVMGRKCLSVRLALHTQLVSVPEIIYEIINSMELSPSQEAGSRSTVKESLCLL
jgi:hypothetical protein